MIRCDAIVVGGGPAGSSCARKLRLAGWQVVVVDRARFPRDKVCAGWLTPDVFPLLDLDPAAYRSDGCTLQEITGFRTRVIGGSPVETRYPRTISYAIRRCEFDHFLLRRAGVQIIDDAAVTSIRRGADTWIVNDRIQARPCSLARAGTSARWPGIFAAVPTPQHRSWPKKRNSRCAAAMAA